MFSNYTHNVTNRIVKNIRYFRTADAKRIVEIEHLNDPDSMLTESLFMFAQRHPRMMTVVIAIKGEVIGFMSYKLMWDQFMITHIAIDPDYHRLGYGTAFVWYLHNKLSDGNMKDRIVSLVPDNLLPCHLFFKSLGFHASMLKNAFGDQDGYYFERTL